MSGITAELCGGPMDGQWITLNGEPEMFEVPEIIRPEIGRLCEGPNKIITHVYRRRRDNGVPVRLPGGLYPYDWQQPQD
jgi:hypothetical protein